MANLVMMGTGTFAEPTFQALISNGFTVSGLVTQPDKAKGQARGSTRQTGLGMKEIAIANGIPVIQPDSINDPNGIEALRAFQPDLLVVAAYGQILSDEVLTAAPQGGINVHASLLPEYRGAAPIAWAIYHGETETGVTIIRMSTKLDAGDMLAQQAVPIEPDETAGEVEARLAPLGAQMAVDVIRQMEKGPVEGPKQDPSLVTRAPKLRKEHGLINWSRQAHQVRNQIRAMLPWPTAYTFWNRQGQKPLRLIVHRAQVVDLSHSREPGALVLLPEEKQRLLVACGNGTTLEVLELQPAGKKRMPTADLLRGRAPQEGDKFGEESEG